MKSRLRAADESTVAWLDRLAAVWVTLWLLVGVWAGTTVWHIADIGDTITTAGTALDAAGRALASVPLIGGQVDTLGNQVIATSAKVSDRGQDVKGELRQIAILLGFFLVAMPSLPVLCLYVPQRLGRNREIAEIRRALAQDEGGVEVDEVLARRAMGHLSFAELRSLLTNDDHGKTQSRRLADAELQRLGLTRPAG